MPRKISPERREQLNTRDELERLINQDVEQVQSLIQQAGSVLPGRPIVEFLDYNQVKKTSDSEADDIVSSITDFYLGSVIIKEIDYIKQKNIIDHITISSLLFQMKTAEHAVIKLLEQIDNGNTHPRTFEVLSSLQRSKMDIIKHLAQFMVIMENNYKSLREDYRVKKAEEPQNGEIKVLEENTTGNKIKGTRSLMETIRQLIPEQRAVGDIQKDNIIEIDVQQG